MGYNTNGWDPDAVRQITTHGGEGFGLRFTRASMMRLYLHGRLQLQFECYNLPVAHRFRYRLVIFEAAPFARFSAECTYDPLAAASAELIAEGSATISATTEI